MSIIGNIGGQSGGGSLTKSILIVAAPTGSTVTVTKGSTTKTAMEKNGEWWFKGLENGEWTIRATLGGQSATAAYKIEQFGVYRTSIAYFKATINVTYPAGSTCTATDGKTTLNAPDTSGTWACIVPDAGEWKIKANEAPEETISVNDSGDYTAYPGFLFYYGRQRFEWDAIGCLTTSAAPSQRAEAPTVETLPNGAVKLTIGLSVSGGMQARGGYVLRRVDMTSISKIQIKIIASGSVFGESTKYDMETGLFIEPPDFTGYKTQAIAYVEPKKGGTSVLEIDTSSITRNVDVFVPITRWVNSASATILEVAIQ